MKKRTVIYARFSSHSQTEQSIEGQLRECYDYAKKHDLRKATEKEKPSRRSLCGRRTDGHLPDILTSCLRMCRMTCPSCKPPP